MESGPDYFQGTKKQGKNDKSKMSKKAALKENFDLEVYFIYHIFITFFIYLFQNILCGINKYELFGLKLSSIPMH